MGYETARSTVLLETSCVCCRRPLRDAESVELGIGPDCRAKYGFGVSIPEEARAEANRLVHEASLPHTTADRVLEAAARIAELGLLRLASTVAANFVAAASPAARERVRGLVAASAEVRLTKLESGWYRIRTPYEKDGGTKRFNVGLKAEVPRESLRPNIDRSRRFEKFDGWDFSPSYLPAVMGLIAEFHGGATLVVLEQRGRKEVETDRKPVEAPAARPAAPAKPEEVRELVSEDGRVALLRAPYDPSLVEAIKLLPREDRTWKKAISAWEVRIDTREKLDAAILVARTYGLRVSVKLPDAGAEAASRAASRADGEAAAARAAAASAFPFQVDGARWLADDLAEGFVPRRRLLADDMGLGKTWQALFALRPDAAALVVVPASVKYNWLAELRALRPDLRGEVLEGRAAFRWPSPGEVLFVNYDILPARFAGKEPKMTEEDRASASRATLVVDEAQAVRNSKARRSQAVRNLADACLRTWFLTGTPVENRTRDAWHLAAALGCASSVFGSYERFKRLVGARDEVIFVKGGGRRVVTVWPPDADGVSAEACRLLRAKVMLRRTKPEVLPQLPPKVRSYRVVEAPGQNLSDMMDDALRRIGSLGGKLPGFEMFSEVRRALAYSRIPAMLEVVEEHEEAGEQLVVFSEHRGPVHVLAGRDGWAAITGDVPAEERQRIAEDFRAGRLRGVALTISAGNYGLNLQSASRMLFVDRNWNPKTNTQAEDRINRIGQTAGSTHYTFLTSEHPLDAHVNALLDAKEATIDALVDGR